MTDKPSKRTPSEEDELHRKFREALQRKKAAPHDTPASEPGHHEGAGPANADVARKEFRRKTG